MVIVSYTIDAKISSIWVGRYINGTNVYAQFILSVHNGSYYDENYIRKGSFATPIDTVITLLKVTYLNP